MAQATGAPRKQSGFADHPDYRVDFEPCAEHVRVTFNGEVVADSRRARVMKETAQAPVYYVPRDDVRMDLTTRTDHHSYCPFKGEASYWTLGVGGRSAENALWSYEEPYPEIANIKDYVAFYADRVDGIVVGD